MLVIQYIQDNILPFTLVLLRLTTLMLTMPIFGFYAVSPRIRVLLALGMTTVIFPVINKPIMIDMNLSNILILSFREILIGLTLGLGAQLIFEAFNFSGTLISQHIGYGIVTAFDPFTQQQSSTIAQFWYLLMMVYIFALNAHIFFLQVLVHNFSLLPIGSTILKPEVAGYIMNGTSLFFEIGFKIAAPIIMLMLVLEVALALIARVMPQMNVFFVSLPLKLGVGLMAIYSALSVFQSLFAFFIDDVMRFIEGIFEVLR